MGKERSTVLGRIPDGMESTQIEFQRDKVNPDAGPFDTARPVMLTDVSKVIKSGIPENVGFHPGVRSGG